MLRNLKLRPTRSISFSVENYTVQTSRKRPIRNRIYASNNTGFNATPTKLTRSSEHQARGNGIARQESNQHMDLGLRRFVIHNQDTVKFSSPFDKDDFITEGSSGQFKVDERFGRLLGLELFGNKLLVIQEFGFSTLDIAFDASEFNLQILVKTYEHIIPNTARVLGDTVFFLTAGGMCRIRRGIVELLDIDVVFNVAHKYVSVIHQNRYHLVLESKILVIEKFFDSFFYIDKNSDNAKWATDFFALGYAADRQFLKQIRLCTSSDLTIVIVTESREQRINVRGRNNVQRINLNIKGDAFKIEFETNAENIEISNLVAVVGFLPSGYRALV
ncbi:MAG: hypothetical protein FWE45_02630 [Firmicutes bacterium]|nr:hypothetical protein [Bacillota bacterium]